MMNSRLFIRILLCLTLSLLLTQQVFAETATLGGAEENLSAQDDETTLTPEDEESYKKIYKEMENLSKNRNKPAHKPELSVQALYDAFKFNSTVGNFYNRFYGRTQLLNLGGVMSRTNLHNPSHIN